jgi:predicted CXXCH cytochrome family protein
VKLLVVTRESPQAAPARKTVTADWVRVGRHASSEIFLPDPRIALAQGMLVWRDGLVYIEGEEGVVSKATTRKAVSSVRLNPGVTVDIGPYRLQAIPAPAGYDGAVSVERVRASEAEPELQARASRLTLASLGLAKRRVAWLAFLLVLALCLLVPAGRVLQMPWTAVADLAGVSDRAWNPGPVMLAHEPIAARCDACHQVAFAHVADTACLECHSKVGRHDGDAAVTTANSAAHAGSGNAIHRVALFEGARCTSCHLEHKGAKATHRDDDAFCVACHRDIRAKSGEARAMNASDFARDHPQFQLTLQEKGAIRRVRLDEAPLAQHPGLKFTHAKHLDPSGVKSPDKGRVKLECGSCHVPDSTKRAFEPLSFAKRCQECHTLQFEPAVTARQVPHGKPADAALVIDDFYANLALKGTPDSFRKAFGVPGEGLLRRVGSPSDDDRRNALALAGAKARRVATDLFEVRVCKQCHEVTRKGARGGAAAWDIAPVTLTRRWMPHARFDHSAHAQAPCADCHDVERSKSSADIAMPGIAKCRECHGGSRPVEGKVTSNCLLCHGFHDSATPWDPAFVPKSHRVAGRADAR